MRNSFAIACGCVVGLAFAGGSSKADIYQWEYINPADPSQGKRQSTTLAPDGAGVDAVAGFNLAGRDLTMAYLSGAFLSGLIYEPGLVGISKGNLSGTNLTKADLTGASLSIADLSDANFTDAEIRGAIFSLVPSYGGTGISLAQLYSTASYKAHDLSGINLAYNNLAGGNFVGQNLTQADFGGAVTICGDPCTTYVTKLAGADLTNADLRGANLFAADLTDAEFTGANIQGANLGSYSFYPGLGIGISLSKLYSTASYQTHDLSGINFAYNKLAGGDFAAQKLANAVFEGATLTDADFRDADLANASFRLTFLTDADFTDADVRGANFQKGLYSYEGTGITPAQLYSTASHRAFDLSGINLSWNNLTGADFAGQNLTNAHFDAATLMSADFSQANLTNADFTFANFTGANFSGADIRGANFPRAGVYDTGITLAQLYSTASYQAHDLTGIDLRWSNLVSGNFAGQNLTNAEFEYSTLAAANFREANLTNASFYSASLPGADFGQANLANANFRQATLTAADFRRANLANAMFFQANATDAKFAGQNLANTEFGAATLTGADFIDADVRGAKFAKDAYSGGTGITLVQLNSTASYQARDLSGIGLWGNDLADGNFSGQNLTNADFGFATLTGADFTDANVRGATFYKFLSSSGITLAQLYSTASYQALDLTGIGLLYNDLTGGNFAHQNLANASFYGARLAGADFSDAKLVKATFTNAILTGADFSDADVPYANFGAAILSGAKFRRTNLTNAIFGYSFCFPLLGCVSDVAALMDADLTAADARGSVGLELSNLSGATISNLIWPDGHINGLDLDAGALLMVRDYDGSQYDPSLRIPITVDEHLAMAGGTLRMVFEADAWDSTISFAPGIPVTLGGSLELTFAADVNLTSQIGRTFDLFDWTGVTPTGTFAISSSYTWDVSNLYATGDVTLTAIPEPGTLLLTCCALIALVPAVAGKASFRLIHRRNSLVPYITACPRIAKLFTKRNLLVLICGACQLLARRSAAAPDVVFTGHFTDRYAPHSITGWPQGDFVQIGVALETSDPAGSPTIVVNAKQGNTTLTLDWYSLPSTIYPSPHLYYKFIALDPALTGPWQIIPADSTGVGASVVTNAIAAPEFLPVVEEISVGGSPVGATVEWTLPDLTGFDVEWAQVRVVQVSPLSEVFQSDFLPASTTSFELPAGILQVGVEYVYSINLTDFQGANRENRSGALSEIFRYTTAGDYNGNGTVDAADYVVWRKTDGTQSDYALWRAHFGETLGGGPSADANAVIPEPDGLIPLLSALATLLASVAR